MSINADLYSTISPLFTQSLLCTKLNKTNINIASKCFGCLLYLAYSCWVLQNYTYDRQWIDLFHVCDSIIIVTTKTLCDIIFKSQVVKYLTSVTNIDKSLSIYLKINVSQAYGQWKCPIILTVIFCTALVYGLPLLHYVSLDYNLDLITVGEILSYKICFGTIFYQLKFFAMVALIKQRYGWLNIKLRISCKKLRNIKQRIRNDYLKQIQRTHLELSKLCQEVNYAYSFHLFYLLLETFLLSAAVILYIIQEYYNEFQDSSKTFMIFLCLRLAFVLIQTFGIIYVCSVTVAEAKLTGLVLMKQCYRHDLYFKSQANQFCFQLIHHPIEFEACGIKLDGSAILSIIASLALYIPLIITFNLLSEHSKFNCPTQWFRSQAHAMFQTENIYSSLTPIYYLTKVMGFAPFKLNGKTTKIYSAFHLLWSSFLIIVFGIYATFAVNTAPSEDTLVLKITDSMNIHLCIFSMCGGIFFACIFRNNMSSIVRDLDVVDKEFQGTQFDLKKSYMKTKLYLVIATCVILIYTLAMLTNIFLEHLTSVDYLTFGVTLAYSAPLFPILPLAQFSTFAIILRKRFMWINERMEKVGLQQKLKKTSGSSEKEHLLALIQDLGDKHHKLCTISKKLNKVYAAQILLFMMQAFLMLVTVSFFLIKTYYLRSFSAITIYENIYYPNMLIFHIILLLTVTLICASTTKEARKAGTILHNVVPMYAFSSANCLDLGAACFSLQLLHHNVKFTACRLFPIDETLLYTIVGAATTYLVIVLQFEFGVSGANTQQCNNTITTTTMKTQ